MFESACGDGVFTPKALRIYLMLFYVMCDSAN
jgi:hypothetical protein